MSDDITLEFLTNEKRIVIRDIEYAKKRKDDGDVKMLESYLKEIIDKISKMDKKTKGDS